MHTRCKAAGLFFPVLVCLLFFFLFVVFVIVIQNVMLRIPAYALSSCTGCCTANLNQITQNAKLLINLIFIRRGAEKVFILLK